MKPLVFSFVFGLVSLLAFAENDDIHFETGGNKVPNIEIRALSVFPLGNLSRIFKVAPGFDAFLCIPVKKSASIDIGMLFAFPVDSKTFVFKYQEEANDTKSSFLFDFNLRYSRNHKIHKKLFCKPHIGIGVSSLTTDLPKETDEDGNNVYHSIVSSDFFGGISLMYNKIGFFVEYHHVPYAVFNANKISNNFGTGFLNAGLLFSF